MSDLRLGAVHLAPKEIAFVRALVRLFAHTEKLGWTFADAPPYHAVVTDPAARSAHPGFFASFKGHVLTLVDGAGTPAMDTVAYPIRANQFRDWLKLRQDGPPVATAGAGVEARRYKLRRWPPAALLQGDPVAMRMASLMSRNALTTAQLASLMQQPLAQCEAFVATLRDAGLLQELVAAPAAAPVAAVPADAPARGLMASLRRHLGLQEKP